MTSLVNKPLFKTVSSHPFVQGVYMPHSLSWAQLSVWSMWSQGIQPSRFHAYAFMKTISK